MSDGSIDAGRVYLVGAGPGDPGLITVRGAECLSEADLVLYDGLVNPLLLRLTTGRCERTARIRRSDGDPVVAQSEINARLIKEAQLGRVVVRLKGGDPYIFGRGSEEVAALHAAGVPFEVIPGITAATAAGEYAGFSYTHRAISSAVAFVTGHEDPTRPDSRLNFAALAAFPGTLVFYMGLSRLSSICDNLTKNGLSSETPAAVICHASLPRQQVVIATLATLAELADEAGMTPPSLIVVGECVRQRTQLSWFERRPLFGCAVGIVRPSDQFTDIAQQVTSLGGEAVSLPLLERKPLSEEQMALVEKMMNRIGEFDWLIFTSANAVREFARCLWNSGGDGRSLSRSRIAAVGKQTEQALVSVGLRADVVPDKFDAEHLMHRLSDEIADARVLWIRGRHARPTISERLTAAEVSYEELVVYAIADASTDTPDSLNRLSAADPRQLDWVAVASPRAASAFAAACRQRGIRAEDAPRLAAISDLTAQTLSDAGFPASIVPESASWSALVEAIASH